MVLQWHLALLLLLHRASAKDLTCSTSTAEVDVERASALLQVDFKGEKVKSSQVPLSVAASGGFPLPAAATNGPSGPDELMSKLQHTFGAAAPTTPNHRSGPAESTDLHMDGSATKVDTSNKNSLEFTTEDDHEWDDAFVTPIAPVNLAHVDGLDENRSSTEESAAPKASSFAQQSGSTADTAETASQDHWNPHKYAQQLDVKLDEDWEDCVGCSVVVAQTGGAHDSESKPTPAPENKENKTENKTKRDKEKCIPKCKWFCEKRECDQICKPKCDVPRCQTRCKGLSTDGCEIKCGEPKCQHVCHCPCDITHNDSSPPDNCPMTNCPFCETECSRPMCQLKCPPGTQKCREVCEEPACKWKCSKPKQCPVPTCVLKCESPKNCADMTFKELPALGPNETIVQTFQMPLSLAQLEGISQKNMAIPVQEVLAVPGSSEVKVVQRKVTLPVTYQMEAGF